MVPLSCSFYPANKSDVSTNIVGNLKVPKSKLIHKLIGDKGYIVNILKRKRKIKNVKFDIITPFRKNQTTKNNERDKKLLQN